MSIQNTPPPMSSGRFLTKDCLALNDGNKRLTLKIYISRNNKSNKDLYQ